MEQSSTGAILGVSCIVLIAMLSKIMRARAEKAPTKAVLKSIRWWVDYVEAFVLAYNLNSDGVLCRPKFSKNDPERRFFMDTRSTIVLENCFRENSNRVTFNDPDFGHLINLVISILTQHLEELDELNPNGFKQTKNNVQRLIEALPEYKDSNSIPSISALVASILASARC
ncbi:MAG: hypothetical protein WCL30_00540 [Pseudomonadota bacterium]